jgi:protein TonB
MKTQETTNPQMDEIVFEKRNKMYGAYILRKMYNKQVIKATLLSVAILIAGLAYPLVSSFTAKNRGNHIWIDTSIEVMSTEKPPAELPELPQAPPDNSEIQKQVRFVPPIVVNEEVIDYGILNQDILNQSSVNDPVNITIEKFIEKQPVIIDVPEEKKEIFITAEEMPFYPGGETERLKFLAENIQYPELALASGIQGTVYLQFVIDSKGNITDVKIIRGIGGGCEDEALRVIKMMPPWHPGKQNGRTVRVLYTMPVSFKIRS